MIHNVGIVYRNSSKASATFFPALVSFGETVFLKGILQATNVMKKINSLN